MAVEKRLIESKVQTWEEAGVLSDSSTPLMAYLPSKTGSPAEHFSLAGHSRPAEPVCPVLPRSSPLSPLSPLSPPTDATPLWTTPPPAQSSIGETAQRRASRFWTDRRNGASPRASGSRVECQQTKTSFAPCAATLTQIGQDGYDLRLQNGIVICLVFSYSWRSFW